MQNSMKKSFLAVIFCLMASVLVDAKSESKQSEKILNKLLADHGVLLFQTLNYHWNLEGKEFHDYHLLFDKQYKQLFENLDLIAERIRAIQGKALGSMKDFLKNAKLQEDIGETPEPEEMIQKLFSQYEKIIKNIRNSIKMLEKESKDFATRKMLEDLLEQHEKSAWMLRSLTK
jgi:starvation-inducible DNA-binding protein